MERLPRVPGGRYGLGVKIVVLIAAAILASPPAGLAGDWIELKSGERIEGDIVAVTPESILIEVQVTPSIRDRQTVSRADVAGFQKATQDDIAFADVKAIKVPVTADSPAPYDVLLEGTVRPFLENYAYSKHISEARKVAAELEAERDRLAAGEVKIDGKWVTPDEMAADPAGAGAALQLSKMKNAPDPSTALAAFEVLEKQYSASPVYPEAVLAAREQVQKLRGDITRARNDLERRLREQAEGLELASIDRRMVMEEGIERERAAMQARVQQVKDAGSKWIPVLPDGKFLDELSKHADAEQARLSKIEVEAMASGVKAAREARKQIADGDLAAAKESLARAEKLWQRNAGLASLREELRKAGEAGAPTPTPAP